MKMTLNLFFVIISIQAFSQAVIPGDSPLEFKWKYVGSPDFTGSDCYWFSFTLGPDGTPYASYGIQTGYTTYLPAVKKFDGTQWVFVGSHPFGNGYYDYPSLAVSPSGEPYLAFEECSPYCHASCMKYNGSDWVYVNSQGDLLGGEAEYINMNFSPAGEPWVVFSEMQDSEKVSVKKYDGTQWNYVGPSGFSEPFAIQDCLAFSASGEAYVAYRYGNPPYIRIRKFDGTNWVTVGTPILQEGFFLSLAVDTSGNPWVAFDDYSVNFRLSVMRFDGSQWIYFGQPGISSTRISNAIIAFNPSGEPWVTYSGYTNNTWVSVIRFYGNQWVYVGDSIISPNSSDPVNLVFRSNGEPFVGFCHTGCNVVKYDSLYTGIWLNQLGKMLLYPNPATSFITINLSIQETLEQTLKITDLRGIRMLEKPLSGNIMNLDISDFPSGIYFVEITCRESSFYGKFCKK